MREICTVGKALGRSLWICTDNAHCFPFHHQTLDAGFTETSSEKTKTRPRVPQIVTFARIHWHYAAAEFLQSNLVPSLCVCSVSPKALKTQKAIILFLPPVKISSDRWEKDWGRRGTGGVRMVHRGQTLYMVRQQAAQSLGSSFPGRTSTAHDVRLRYY